MTDSAYDLNAPMEAIIGRKTEKARKEIELRCSRIAQVALDIALKVENGDIEEAIIMFGRLRQEYGPLIGELRLLNSM